MYWRRLHAIDLTTGHEKNGSPSQILAASKVFPGQGVVNFEASQQLQRAGLTLASGTVYAAFGSHCGAAPYQVILMSQIISQRVRAHMSWTHAGFRDCVCCFWVALRCCALPGAFPCHAQYFAV